MAAAKIFSWPEIREKNFFKRILEREVFLRRFVFKKFISINQNIRRKITTDWLTSVSMQPPIREEKKKSSLYLGTFSSHGPIWIRQRYAGTPNSRGGHFWLLMIYSCLRGDSCAWIKLRIKICIPGKHDPILTVIHTLGGTTIRFDFSHCIVMRFRPLSLFPLIFFVKF